MMFSNIMRRLVLYTLLLLCCHTSFAQNTDAEMYYQKAEELKKTPGAKNWKLILDNYAKASTKNHPQALLECAKIVAGGFYSDSSISQWVRKNGKKYWTDNPNSYGGRDLIAKHLLKNAADQGDDMACFMIGVDNMGIQQNNDISIPNLDGTWSTVRQSPITKTLNVHHFGFTQQNSAFYLNKAVSNGYKPAILAQRWADAKIKSNILSNNIAYDVMKMAEENPHIAYMLACMYKEAKDEGKALYWFNIAYQDFNAINLNISATTAIAPVYPTVVNKESSPKVLSNVENVDVNIPITTKKSANTYVLVIANENYDDVKNVDYALSDGKVFKEYCLKTLGVPAENIQMRENATLNKMIAGFDWLTDICSVTNGEANVIVYYSGHGFPNEATQDSYLLPVDGSGKNTRTGFSLNELYSTLAQVKAQSVTVFLDACFCGATRGNDMLVAARGVAIKAKSGSPQGNMTIFCAAQGNETAYPYEKAKHGMFTYFLLKKLKDTKGEVTLGELGDYIQIEVSKQSVLINGKSQTPAVSVSSSMEQEWRHKTMIPDKQ